MGRTIVESWNRLSFVARLLTTASFALLVAGVVMVTVSAGQDARDARDDIAQELAGELLTLPAALAEVVVIGDFSTLQQTLDRYVERPRVSRVAFVDTSGVVLNSQDKRLPGAAPDWFRRWLGFEDGTGRAPVLVGGRRYGDLEITMTAQGLANRAWQRLHDHLAILALAIFLDFLGIWLVLRGGLAPLKRLEKGAEALAEGALDTRIESEGSPEMRHVIDAFNQMAAATQAARDRMNLAHSDLKRFAEVSAHHLMEPARLMISYSQRLRAHLRGALEADAEARENLDFIEQQAKRLRHLLRDVRLYLAADQAQEEVGPVNVNQVLKVVRDWLARDLGGLDATVTVEDLPPAWLDRERLREIFTILLHNAVQYRRPGAALTIHVSGQVLGRRVRYAVTDNGSGIPPEFRDRVFRVFERLHPDADEQSTGIGLAIVRRILESSGGRAWIEETPGGGTTVFVELPAKSSE